MKKSSKVKFYHQFNYYRGDSSFARPNLIYRLCEDAAYTQKSLGDKGSLRTQENIKGTNFHLNNFKQWPGVKGEIVSLIIVQLRDEGTLKHLLLDSCATGFIQDIRLSSELHNIVCEKNGMQVSIA